VSRMRRLRAALRSSSRTTRSWSNGAVPFGAGGLHGAWGGHSEGLVVSFDPYRSESWIGNFQPGAGRSVSGGWEGVLEHPNGQHLIVVARGQAYVVDPETRQLVTTFSASIQHAIPLPDFDAIPSCDGLLFEAIKGSGLWWQSPRMLWDEVKKYQSALQQYPARRGDSHHYRLGGATHSCTFCDHPVSGRI
jgi:hypothetical protein